MFTLNEEKLSIPLMDFLTSRKPSTLGFKYPTWRSHPLHSGDIWLDGKREDDGAEGLWRVHDGLYDLTNFVKNHPGGSDWLEMTKGTDITEVFESHHLSTLAEDMLPTFFIRKAVIPRNSPFTFNENDFYKTLKKNVREVIPTVPTWPKVRSKLITDFLLLGYLSLAVLSAYLRSFVLGAIAGVFLSCTAIAAHNFFHQRDNFRMYYFDFSLMRSRSWRISHIMSHHMYTNTIKDLEISNFEPFLYFLPEEKPLLFRCISWLYSPIIYCFILIVSWIKEILYCIFRKKGFNKIQFLPFTVPLLIYLLTGHPPLEIGIMFLWIITMASLHFGIVSVNSAHHHPDIFHDGDTPRSKEQMDWGVYQLDAVMDRKEITGSHFLVLTNFGDHSLHHLFPTLDHGILEYLYPTFKKTCEEFGIAFRMTSQLELIKGQFRQLAKIQPNVKPPKSVKKQADVLLS